MDFLCTAKTLEQCLALRQGTMLVLLALLNRLADHGKTNVANSLCVHGNKRFNINFSGSKGGNYFLLYVCIVHNSNNTVPPLGQTTPGD